VRAPNGTRTPAQAVSADVHRAAAVREQEQPGDAQRAQMLLANRDTDGQAVDDQRGAVVDEAFGAPSRSRRPAGPRAISRAVQRCVGWAARLLPHRSQQEACCRGRERQRAISRLTRKPVLYCGAASVHRFQRHARFGSVSR
jgi:hypothetical protein